MKKSHYIAVAAATLLINSTAWAGALTIPNAFTAGTPAVAADVNANFTAAKTAVDDNNTRINTVTASAATNTTDIAANTAAITALQNTALVRTINVSPVIGGGGVIDAVASGTALIAAVGAITGSSVTNQFTVKLEPGTYDLGVQALQLPDGVSLEGSGQDVTTITSALPLSAVDPVLATVNALGSSVIRNITLEGSAAVGPNNSVSGALNINAGAVLIENAKVIAEVPIILNGANNTAATVIQHSRILTRTVNFTVYLAWGAQDTLRVTSSEFGLPGSGIRSGSPQCFSSYKSGFTATTAGCL